MRTYHDRLCAAKANAVQTIEGPERAAPINKVQVHGNSHRASLRVADDLDFGSEYRVLHKVAQRAFATHTGRNPH
jgi:hypothetical protein